MHWSFAGEMFILLFGFAALNITLLIAGLIVNLKRQEKGLWLSVFFDIKNYSEMY
ncbi:MAG: hypothetical protein K2X86_07745 [Cytophagaceae bacterium]|nr:hypothetical protein [Cytophagaceae bacterium]